MKFNQNTLIVLDVKHATIDTSLWSACSTIYVLITDRSTLHYRSYVQSQH